MFHFKKIFLKAVRFAAVFLAAAIIGWLCLGFFPNPLEENSAWDWTVRITDRHGRLLKEVLPPKTARRFARPLNEFSPSLIAAVLTAEDKRFYSHLGVDPLAMLRAGRLNVKHGRIISGGSTITMQLARLNRGLNPGPRTLGRKIREIWWALLLERHNSKDTILNEYLNRAPCGNLTEGFPAAARLYLGKGVDDLSAAESAFLAGLPASPGAFNPYKDPRPALSRRGRILDRMAENAFLSPLELSRAKAEPLALKRVESPFNAPHFVSHIMTQLGPEPPALIKTSLDMNLQEEVEKAVREAVASYHEQGLSQAAVVVMNHDRQVLAWVGSVDFFDLKEGQNDGVLATRQPGSALKPFLYASALDRGIINPGTLMDDRAVDYRALSGSFSPSNYSGTFHGPVPARLALASSLNLPAIKLAEKLGVDNILSLLRQLGLESLQREAEYYGLGLALGGGEVNLLSLTSAYAALADQGTWRPPVLFQGSNEQAGQGVFSPGAAFIISDILSDSQARLTGFGFASPLDTSYPAAVKTGTSKNFRDNWCLGYTSSYIIGVWAGNFQSNPMSKVSGVTGAGTVWRKISDLMAEHFPADGFKMPDDVREAFICPVSGLPLGPDCPNRKAEYFLTGFPPAGNCRHDKFDRETMGVEVPVLGLKRSFGLLRPLPGEIYAFDPGINPAVQNIKAQIQSVPGVDELIWRLNGRILKQEKVKGYARTGCLIPLIRGQAKLEVSGLFEGKEVYKSRVEYFVK